MRSLGAIVKNSLKSSLKIDCTVGSPFKYRANFETYMLSPSKVTQSHPTGRPRLMSFFPLRRSSLVFRNETTPL